MKEDKKMADEKNKGAQEDVLKENAAMVEISDDELDEAAGGAFSQTQRAGRRTDPIVRTTLKPGLSGLQSGDGRGTLC